MPPKRKRARLEDLIDLDDLSEKIMTKVVDNLKKSGVVPGQQVVADGPEIGTGSTVGDNRNNIPTVIAKTSGIIPSASACNPPQLQIQVNNEPQHVNNLNAGHLEGLNPLNVVVQPPPSYKPLNRPLYTRVSNKLKEKIVTNQYIDMSDLLELNAVDDDVMPLSVNKFGQVGVITAKKARKALSIEAWTDAFSIYSSVLRQANPHDITLTEDLATYMFFIRSICKDNGRWYHYDTTFRAQKAQDSSMRWNEIDTFLYPKSLLNNSLRDRANQGRYGYNSSYEKVNQPFRACYPFNKGRYCDGRCGYPHICLHCSGFHSRKSCPKLRDFRTPITDGPIPQLPLQATLMQQREKLPRAAPCHMQQLLNPKPGRRVSQETPFSPPDALQHSKGVSASELLGNFDELVCAALAPSTRSTYRRAWEKFNCYSRTVFSKLVPIPVSINNVALFVSYLYQSKFAPSTISTYLSAIGYVHKILGFDDPTQSFLVQQLLQGAYKLRPSFDTRLPITIDILTRLIESVPVVVPSLYEQRLFQALFAFAFAAFARIGELVYANDVSLVNVLQLSDLSFNYNGSVVASVDVSFRCYKHHYSGAPSKITQ